jgi:serine phosphatase RsbU (regulator of sigma subunit)
VLYHGRLNKLTKAKTVPLAVMTEEELTELGRPFENCRAHLPSGSKLVLYTDGLVEAREKNSRKEFGTEIEQQFINLEQYSCSEFLKELFRNLIEFHGDDSFDDDICIACMAVP